MHARPNIHPDRHRQALREQLLYWQRSGVRFVTREFAEQCRVWLQQSDEAEHQPPDPKEIRLPKPKVREQEISADRATAQTGSHPTSDAVDTTVGVADAPRETRVPPGSHSASVLEQDNSVGNETWNTPLLPDDQRAASLGELAQQARECTRCASIVCQRKQTVFGIGNRTPEVVFIGEAPGADEDRLGEPFVGKAGELLTKIIVASKMSREQVYILNALKCRPPGNRTPTDAEIENCRPFFETQLEILQPKYIVCLGATAVRAILGQSGSIGKLRGRWHTYKGAKVLVTYHPAYLLRYAPAKKSTWEDMQMLMREMGLL